MMTVEEFNKRVKSVKELKDDWYPGDIAPKPEFTDWVANNLLKIDPLPWICTTPEGGILSTWEFKDFLLELTVLPNKKGIAEFYGFTNETLVELDMETQSSWDFVKFVIQRRSVSSV